MGGIDRWIMHEQYLSSFNITRNCSAQHVGIASIGCNRSAPCTIGGATSEGGSHTC